MDSTNPFQDPEFLYFSWILPILIVLLIYAHRKRIATAKRFVDPEMVQRLMPATGELRPWIKGAAIVLGIACLLLAAARPRWGVYFEKISARGVDLFVLLDVSKSMLAEDVTPNRLGRAKADILDLLQRLEGDRVGLITFAKTPVVMVPLTTDQGFFRMVLADVGTDSAPRGGTMIGTAINKAVDSMPEDRHRDQVIVLITDGQQNAPEAYTGGEVDDTSPKEAAVRAAERKVKIITVGLGDTNEGARIPIRDERGNLVYVKDDQQEVWSRMHERLLKEIALTTEGAYIPARTRAYDLGQIYEEHLAGLTRGDVYAEKRKRYRERFQLFVCLGLGFLLLEMMIPRHRRYAAVPA